MALRKHRNTQFKKPNKLLKHERMNFSIGSPERVKGRNENTFLGVSNNNNFTSVAAASGAKPAYKGNSSTIISDLSH